MKIAVIGGGAAGMLAAIQIAKSKNEAVILEHTKRLGKKLLLTGSGKCNISNEDMSLSHYHGHDSSLKLVKDVLKAVSPNEVLDILKDLGLVTRNKNGYIYPFSEQAASVLDILRFAVRDYGVKVIDDFEPESIKRKANSGFVVKSGNKELIFDKIIIAAGSSAAPKTGSDGTGYKLAEELGHHVFKPLCALTNLECTESFFPSIAGIRCHAKVTIAGREETGELQLTKNGISGINVFNLSYLAAEAMDKGEKTAATIDFMPELDGDELRNLLLKKRDDFSDRPLEEFFAGILNKNLGMCIIKQTGISVKLTDAVNKLTDKDIKRLSEKLKNFTVSVKAAGDFDRCQCVYGGVDTNEVTELLESKKNPGIYFAGEILDVNGDCGGYNLTFAFASGILAARAACGMM